MLRDIQAAAKSIDKMLDPVLSSYINKSQGIKPEHKQRCQEALRSPLHALIGLTELASESMSNTISEEDMTDMRLTMSSEAYDVAVATHELILFSATDEYTKIPCKDAVQLNETIHSILDGYDLRNKTLEKKFKTAMTDDVTINTHLTTLREILHSLITTSDRYAKGGALVVETLQNADGTYTVMIANEGPEVDINLKEEAFQPFSIVTDRKADIGLSLALARRLGKSMNYDVDIDTTYTRGCKFVISGLRP